MSDSEVINRGAAGDDASRDPLQREHDEMTEAAANSDDATNTPLASTNLEFISTSLYSMSVSSWIRQRAASGRSVTLNYGFTDPMADVLARSWWGRMEGLVDDHNLELLRSACGSIQNKDYSFWDTNLREGLDDESMDIWDSEERKVAARIAELFRAKSASQHTAGDEAYIRHL